MALFVRLFQPVDEVNELALGRLEVLFSFSVHIHKEVKEREYFGIDIFGCDLAGAEVKVHIIILSYIF